MNLRIKFNLVIMSCCAISFIMIYLNIKINAETNISLEIENKANLVLAISDKIDKSNDNQSYFTANDVFADVNGFQSLYSIAFTNAKSSDFQANIWQQKIIDSFIENTPDLNYTGIKSDENGEFYILAKAIENLENQIIGAKFVSIYKQQYFERLNSELKLLLSVLIIIFIALFIIINLLIQILIFKPIKLISQEANQISRGQSAIEELSIRGKDEISELSHSFNRIIRSLKAAMKLLND